MSETQREEAGTHWCAQVFLYAWDSALQSTALSGLLHPASKKPD